MLCILLDQNGFIYYELLIPSETITGERYRLQLIRLKRALTKKIQEWENRHTKVICNIITLGHMFIWWLRIT